MFIIICVKLQGVNHFKVLFLQSVFIYLHVTDYLNISNCFLVLFFSQRCSKMTSGIFFFLYIIFIIIYDAIASTGVFSFSRNNLLSLTLYNEETFESTLVSFQ